MTLYAAHPREAEPVAALFVEPDGVYAGLPGVDVWDEARDARKYDGPWPVVAHPPCQRWCRFAKGIEKVHGYKVGDDGGCFEHALWAVRTFGGVLEHPAHSLAWPKFGLPVPYKSGHWVTNIGGGWSAYVEQGRYGHPMRKATWLYATVTPELRWGYQPDSVLGTFKWGHRADKPEHDRNRPRVDGLHSMTPVEFRDALLALARSATPNAALPGEATQTTRRFPDPVHRVHLCGPHPRSDGAALHDRRVRVDAEAPPAPPNPFAAPLPGHRPVLPPAPQAGANSGR